MPSASHPSVLSNVRADRVRRVAALGRRSSRRREGAYLAEGPQSVREAVLCRPDLVREIYLDEAAPARHADILEAAQAAHLPVQVVTAEVLAAMADTEAPQGVLAVCDIATADLDTVLAARPRLLVFLTHVRDPGNAGTVLRGADAMGADAVLVSESSVDVFAPKVVRSTAGSLFHLPVVTALPVLPTLARLREAGVATYAADGAGEVPIGAADLLRPHAWVMGNEAWGLPPEVRRACDDVVVIPIHRAESLNLAMAATICLYASAAAQG